MQVCRSAWKHADLCICCSPARVCMALALLYLEDKTAASCVEECRCARPCSCDSKPKGGRAILQTICRVPLDSTYIQNKMPHVIMGQEQWHAL